MQETQVFFFFVEENQNNITTKKTTSRYNFFKCRRNKGRPESIVIKGPIKSQEKLALGTGRIVDCQ